MQIKVWDLSEVYRAEWITPGFVTRGKSVWSWITEDHEIDYINTNGTFMCRKCEEVVHLDDVDQWKIDEYYEVLADES